MEETISADARRAIQRWLVVKGHDRQDLILERLAPVFGDAVEAALTGLVHRGDVVRLSDGVAPVLVPARKRRVAAGDRIVELGTLGSPASVILTLADEFGQPSWRPTTEREPQFADLVQWANRTGGDAAGEDSPGWSYLADVGDPRLVFRWPDDAPPMPRQLARIVTLFGEAGAESAALLSEVAVWAGLPPVALATDPAQARVVNLAPDNRALVVAGPGAGKTHTMALRARAIVAAGVPASTVHVISFTRAAVGEVRRRLGDDAAGEDVEVSTLDQLAAQIVSGFSRAFPRDGYEATVERATQMIAQRQGNIGAWLATRGYLIVDEAQDVVGPRLAFMRALLEAVPTKCGVTVFADPAQAIYGMANAPRLDADPVTAAFERSKLQRNHRATAGRLMDLALDGQRICLDAGADALTDMRALLERASAGPPPAEDTPEARPPATLHLFATGHAMMGLAARLSALGIATSLRGGAGGVERLARPSLAPAWIADLAPHIDGRRRASLPDALDRCGLDLSASEAAQALAPGVRDGHYNSQAIAAALLAGRLPPLTDPSRAVVLSTIHASKGLEADHVALHLPTIMPSERGAEGSDPVHDARVLYVGGTRARRTLYVDVERRGFARTSGGRYWRRGERAVQVRIAPADAPDTRGAPCDRRPTGEGALTVERTAEGWRAKFVPTHGGEFDLGLLPKTFTDDLWTIAKTVNPNGARPGRFGRGHAILRWGSTVRDDVLTVVPVVDGFVWVSITGAAP